MSEEKKYQVGKATMKHVFLKTGMTNLYDLQAVFDQIEKKLALVDRASDMHRRAQRAEGALQSLLAEHDYARGTPGTSAATYGWVMRGNSKWDRARKVLARTRGDAELSVEMDKMLAEDVREVEREGVGERTPVQRPLDIASKNLEITSLKKDLKVARTWLLFQSLFLIFMGLKHLLF